MKATDLIALVSIYGVCVCECVCAIERVYEAVVREGNANPNDDHC